MNKILNISLIGFDEADRGRFEKTFQYSTRRARGYRIGGSPHMVVVNGDSATAMEEGTRRANDAALPLVIVSRNAPAGSGMHFIAPPLMTSRVLKVLDQVDVTETNQADTATAPHVNPGEAAFRYRALVVDDSLAMRESLKEELATLPVPLKIDFAPDGEQALALAQRFKYDLVFLDIVLPGVDGYEVCKRMRDIAGFRKTPIVMLSGKSSPLDEVKGIIAGASTYLTKPVVHEQFQQVLRRVVKWLDALDVAIH